MHFSPSCKMPGMATTTKRGWFTFTIRDWIWLCVVIGLAIGWSMHVSRAFYLEQSCVAAKQEPAGAVAARDYFRETADALLAAVHNSTLSSEQIKAVGDAFKKELEQRGKTLQESE